MHRFLVVRHRVPEELVVRRPRWLFVVVGNHHVDVCGFFRAGDKETRRARGRLPITVCRFAKELPAPLRVEADAAVGLVAGPAFAMPRPDQPQVGLRLARGAERLLGPYATVQKQQRHPG